MPLGVGDLAIQVVLIYQQQNVGEYVLGAAVQFTDVLAVAGDDHQIGRGLQLLGFTVGLQKGGDVLAFVGARQRQDHGFFRLAQKTVDLHGDWRLTPLLVRRVEALQVRARRYDAHLFRLIVIVQRVLFVDLIVGAGDNQVGGAEHRLLGIDAACHVVLLLDLGRLESGGEQATAFYPSQRVPRVHQRRAEHRGEACADIAGIRVVAVHHVRLPFLVLEVLQGVIGEAVEVIPELLLADIAVRAGIDAHNVGAVVQGFGLLGVIRADLAVDHAPGEQVDALHSGPLGQCAGQLHNVENLSAGVGIAAELQFL